MSLYYSVVASADAQDAMDLPDCLTTAPRMSIDETQALISYSADADGRLDHAQAAELTATSAWSDLSHTPP